MSRPGFLAAPVRVSVPATSANLGPGFDSLGLALDLRDQLTATIADRPSVQVAGEGEGEVPIGADNLVVRAMAAGFEALGVEAPPVALTCENHVPHGRGLGSSAAAIVGGLVLARALVDDGAERLSDSRLLEVASDVEGHPDNVAPALYGGFTVAVSDAGRIRAARLAVLPEISATVFIPPHPVSTETARGLLPAEVSHADAAANAGRAALLVAALTNDPSLLFTATDDRLHQQYRRPAMPLSLDLIERLRAIGVAAVVSGAGPTVLALARRAAADDLAAHGPTGWRVCSLRPGALGARVEHGV